MTLSAALLSVWRESAQCLERGTKMKGYQAFGLYYFLVYTTLIYLLSTRKREFLYSKFKCSSGNQRLEAPLQHTPSKFPFANDYQFKVCLFENVCVHDGGIEYFEDPKSFAPASAKISAWIKTGDPLLSLGYIGPDWSPKINFAALPRNLERKYELVLLDANSFTVNFAHFLLDNIYPQIHVLRLFNIKENAKILLINHNNCDDPRQSWENKSSIFNPHISRRAHCNDLYHHFVPSILGGSYRNLDEMKGLVCYRKLLAGQSSAFSLQSHDLSREIMYRRIRRHVKARYGVKDNLKSNLIIVCYKKEGYDVSFWPGLCEEVRRARMQLQYRIVCSQDCMDPWSFEGNLKMTQRASIFVSEHGSLSHLSVYGPTGAVALIVGHSEFKDPQYFLHFLDKHYLYVNKYGNHSLEQYLQYAEELLN